MILVTQTIIDSNIQVTNTITNDIHTKIMLKGNTKHTQLNIGAKSIYDEMPIFTTLIEKLEQKKYFN